MAPQVLVLLLIGGALDLLGGWNHTDAATGVLMVLVLFNPIVTGTLAIAEAVRYRRRKKLRQTPSFLMTGLAVGLFIEALGANVFLLSQLKMH